MSSSTSRKLRQNRWYSHTPWLMISVGHQCRGSSLSSFVEIEMAEGRVLRLNWSWDLERKRAVQRRHLGKKMIVTDRHHWDDATIAHTYRRLTRTESLFKIGNLDPGIWWPMFHWTDSKIRVHGLYCFFALLLLAILRLKRRDADRVLTEIDDVQAELACALKLDRLAEQLGTTLLFTR